MLNCNHATEDEVRREQVPLLERLATDHYNQFSGIPNLKDTLLDMENRKNILNSMANSVITPRISIIQKTSPLLVPQKKTCIPIGSVLENVAKPDKCNLIRNPVIKNGTRVGLVIENQNEETKLKSQRIVSKRRPICTPKTKPSHIEEVPTENDRVFPEPFDTSFFQQSLLKHAPSYVGLSFEKKKGAFSKQPQLSTSPPHQAVWATMDLTLRDKIFKFDTPNVPEMKTKICPFEELGKH